MELCGLEITGRRPGFPEEQPSPDNNPATKYVLDIRFSVTRLDFPGDRAPRLILLELRNGTNSDNCHEYGSTVGREINQLYSPTSGRSSQVIDNDPPLNAHVHEITRCATPQYALIKKNSIT